MSFIVFTELITKIWTKVNELFTREKSKTQQFSELSIKSINFDSRVIPVYVIENEHGFFIKDHSIYIPIPLTSKPYNMFPIQQPQQIETKTKQGSSSIPEFVVSSRELISSEVAKVLKEYFGINIEPDVKSSEKTEKEVKK